jgi:hypothetical protein
MAPEPVVEAEVAENADVMASVEDGPTERFIIADISRDDAYVTAPLSDTASLPAWR